MRLRDTGRVPAVLALAAFLAVVASSGSPLQAETDSLVADAVVVHEPVQLVVDRLRERLGITELVHVSVLPRVTLVVSVEAPQTADRGYVLSIEQAFLERLSPPEVEAAIAHELGHVWVFTHHPFLQTEPLANRIAQRVVPRDSLASVYRKLWAHGQTTEGDIDALLGPP